MDNSTKLKIEERAKGSKGATKRLRKEGLLPGSISRKGDTSVSISLKYDEFRKAFKQMGQSGVFTLQVGRKKPYSAMIREIQYVPGTYDFLHITFQGISLDEETTADIHLHIQGRDELHHNNYELLQQLESLHMKGLPGDFPQAINIDVSKMVPGDHLTVADVELPEGLTCLTESDRLVLSVGHPKVRADEATGEDTDEAAPAAPAASDDADQKANTDSE